MSKHSDSDNESFHSADEDLDDEPEEPQSASAVEAGKVGGSDGRSGSSEESCQISVVKQPSSEEEISSRSPRPTELWTRDFPMKEEGKVDVAEEEETPKWKTEETPKDMEKEENEGSADAGGGWEVDDWGDFDEESMVTPGTGRSTDRTKFLDFCRNLNDILENNPS